MTIASSPSRANWAGPEPSHTSVGQLEYFGTIGNVQKDGTVLGSSHKKLASWSWLWEDAQTLPHNSPHPTGRPVSACANRSLRFPVD